MQCGGVARNIGNWKRPGFSVDQSARLEAGITAGLEQSERGVHSGAFLYAADTGPAETHFRMRWAKTFSVCLLRNSS